MAVIKPEIHAALAALTTAALGLPGVSAQAATAATEAQGNVNYGRYQESGDRIKVDVYHGDFLVPITDRFEFSYSIDRDTYSGATPAFSMPVAMANQPKYQIKGDGTTAQYPTPADVVSAASGGVTGGGLTILGGLNNFQAFRVTEAQVTREFQERYPFPASPTPPPPPPGPPPLITIPADATITFQDIRFAAYYGNSNIQPQANGACPGAASQGCYNEGAMVVGTPLDPTNAGAHLHRAGTAANRSMQYHADSAGIYVRAQNSGAFNFNSLTFSAPIDGSNPNTGPNALWEILGFNTALNPNLASGDGTNYSTKVANQTVANGFDGKLTIDPAFQNINAFWIHYKGYPATPTSGVDFALKVDNISVSPVQPSGGKTPEQEAWEKENAQYLADLEQWQQDRKAYDAELFKKAQIAAYRAVLDTYIPQKTKIIQRFGEQPLETRTMPVFGVKYYLDDTVLALSGGYSDEPDFHSNFGSANISHEFNDKHTTATLGYNLTSNDIYRSTDYASHGSHHASDPTHNPVTYPNLVGESIFNGVNLSFAQVMSKYTLVQLSGGYINQHGYLTNPYKFVYVRGELTAEDYFAISQTPPGELNIKDYTNLEVVGTELFREIRPGQRNLGSVSLGLSQNIPQLDASLNADYRFFSDDWGIDSHTFELKWNQPLPYGIMATPNLRYYSQSQAFFFAPFFLEPRADGYYSSDFRLSAYGSLSGGITFIKKFGKAISLQAGVEYYTHAGNLKLGGGGEDAYADFGYYLAHAGLNFNLSAPGPSSGEHHHHHHHHGAQPPAGVMFAHMMPKSNDIMIGYRYMYSQQAGDMLHGSSSVDDPTLRDRGCVNTLIPYCLYKPTDMTMHMHMLDLMYAPTDWLNLMVMPQVVDMGMDMSDMGYASQLASYLGVYYEEGHAGGHSSHGLGDTIMVALVKLFERPGHHLHAGLGFSAPTGDLDITMDGRKSSLLKQNYGMQPGSGTWDFKPSLTYTGHKDDFSWGMQLNGVIRMEGRNKFGYVLGDMFQSTAWGGYSPFNWLSASVRLSYSLQGSINGLSWPQSAVTDPSALDNRYAENEFALDPNNWMALSPGYFPSNYGGRFWDVGFGFNLSAPDAEFLGQNFVGHNLSVEWLQPVADDFNGYQLERVGSLFATWTYMF